MPGTWVFLVSYFSTEHWGNLTDVVFEHVLFQVVLSVQPVGPVVMEPPTFMVHTTEPPPFMLRTTEPPPLMLPLVSVVQTTPCLRP
jgi:hypothetical protein